jgi:hypothetical protein
MIRESSGLALSNKMEQTPRTIFQAASSSCSAVPSCRPDSVESTCDETELLPLLIAHRFVRRVRTIQVEVRPLGGDSFKITLDASLPTVGEAKAEIARSKGTAEELQELYRVAERADGLAVREDDAEPEPLADEGMLLGEGDVVAMAVKVSGLCDVLKPCPTSHHV